MTKLILTLGRKTGWAIYQKDKTKKISSGFFQFKECIPEYTSETYDRFYKFLEELFYNYGPIDKIYYQRSNQGNYAIYQKSLRIIQDQSNKRNNLITIYKLKLEKVIKDVLGLKEPDSKKIISKIQNLGYDADNINQCLSIAAIHYVNQDE